jgi:flagellar biosynthesis/type III secretory pathway M-ring protein FliF/YscJ
MVLLKISPSAVHAGWLALVIILALAAVVVLLVWSMRRQMRKIQLPSREDIHEQDAENQQAANPDSSGAEPDGHGTDGQDADEGHPTRPRI